MEEPDLTLPRPAAKGEHLGGLGLAAKEALPKGAVCFGGKLVALVCQKLQVAGLILKELQKPHALFLPVLGQAVAVLAKLRAVGFEIANAAVLFLDETLKPCELDLESR
jgi:hypothetical protein